MPKRRASEMADTPTKARKTHGNDAKLPKLLSLPQEVLDRIQEYILSIRLPEMSDPMERLRLDPVEWEGSDADREAERERRRTCRITGMDHLKSWAGTCKTLHHSAAEFIANKIALREHLGTTDKAAKEGGDLYLPIVTAAQMKDSLKKSPMRFKCIKSFTIGLLTKCRPQVAPPDQFLGTIGELLESMCSLDRLLFEVPKEHTLQYQSAIHRALPLGVLSTVSKLITNAYSHGLIEMCPNLKQLMIEGLDTDEVMMALTKTQVCERLQYLEIDCRTFDSQVLASIRANVPCLNELVMGGWFDSPDFLVGCDHPDVLEDQWADFKKIMDTLASFQHLSALYIGDERGLGLIANTFISERAKQKFLDCTGFSPEHHDGHVLTCLNGHRQPDPKDDDLEYDDDEDVTYRAAWDKVYRGFAVAMFGHCKSLRSLRLGGGVNITRDDGVNRFKVERGIALKRLDHAIQRHESSALRTKFVEVARYRYEQRWCRKHGVRRPKSMKLRPTLDVNYNLHDWYDGNSLPFSTFWATDEAWWTDDPKERKITWKNEIIDDSYPQNHESSRLDYIW